MTNNRHETIFKEKKPMLKTKAAVKKFGNTMNLIDQDIKDDNDNVYHVTAINLFEQTKSKTDKEAYEYYIKSEATGIIYACIVGANGCTASCTAAIEKLYTDVPHIELRPINADTKKWAFLSKVKFPTKPTKVDISVKLPDPPKTSKKETNTMTTPKTTETTKGDGATKSPRLSTTLEPSLAKRQAELDECDQDIDAIRKALETYEASYKGVYNAWCEFDELSTSRKSNDNLLAQFEEVSQAVDDLKELMEAKLADYLEGRKQIERLIQAHTPKGGNDSGSGTKKSKDAPKPEDVPFTPEAKEEHSAEDLKVLAKMQNEVVNIFVPKLKAAKVRVLDTQTATTKRNASIRIVKGRTIEVGRDSKLTLRQGDSVVKTYTLKNESKLIEALQA